jgi:hypothetical protein
LDDLIAELAGPQEAQREQARRQRRGARLQPICSGFTAKRPWMRLPLDG